MTINDGSIDPSEVLSQMQDDFFQKAHVIPICYWSIGYKL